VSTQLVTSQDVEDYGSAFIDLTQRAAHDALAPELNALRAQNQHLRQLAARSQNAEIQRFLDSRVPGWRSTYADSRFADWLAQPDDYSGTVRSRLLRNAVDAGDAGRVAAIYQGFQQEVGQRAPAYQRAQSRQPASNAKPIYTREQIKRLYEQRRLGRISDANWARQEADIIAAGREGRVTSSFDKYGNETRLT
jgi:hypothetical protein